MTLPINLSDISMAVGYSGNDLIANGVINKWAKYKPVDSPIIGNTGRTSGSTWWKGTDGKCGFTIPTFDNIGSPGSSNSFMAKLLAGTVGWTYNRPAGGVNHRHRVFDFDGYLPNAPAPMDQPGEMSAMLSSNNELTVEFAVNRGNEYSLSFADFTINNSPLSGFYVGVLVYLSDSQYTFKASDLVSSGSVRATFSNMIGYAGRYVRVVPFLSSVPISQGVNPGSGTFLSAGVEPTTMLVRPYSTGISATIMPQWASALHERVRYTLNLINVTSGTINAQNVTISLYRSDQINPLVTVSRGDISMAGGAQMELTGVLIMQEPYVSSVTYYVEVTSVNNVIHDQAEVDEYRS